MAFGVGFDEEFERKWTRLQRIAWRVLAVALVAGLFGAWGDGPLAEGRIDGAKFTVRYERIAHIGSLTPLELDVKADNSLVSLSKDCIGSHRLERVVPEATSVHVGEEGIDFVLQRGITRIDLRSFGTSVARCTTSVEGESARFLHIVLP